MFNIARDCAVMEIELVDIERTRLTDKEWELAYAFVEKHKEDKAKPGAFIVTITWCGIGDSVWIKHVPTGKEEDITEYQSIPFSARKRVYWSYF